MELKRKGLVKVLPEMCLPLKNMQRKRGWWLKAYASRFTTRLEGLEG